MHALFTSSMRTLLLARRRLMCWQGWRMPTAGVRRIRSWYAGVADSPFSLHLCWSRRIEGIVKGLTCRHRVPGPLHRLGRGGPSYRLPVAHRIAIRSCSCLPYRYLQWNARSAASVCCCRQLRSLARFRTPRATQTKQAILYHLLCTPSAFPLSQCNAGQSRRQCNL